MKIIFSRKGFDKENGGAASPIFHDNGLCSLPIPAPWEQRDPHAPRYQVKYNALSYDKEDLGSVVEDLTYKPRKGESGIKGTNFCHLDPDLIRGDRVRKAGWLPMFGQGSAAATHPCRLPLMRKQAEEPMCWTWPGVRPHFANSWSWEGAHTATAPSESPAG